MIVPIVQMVSKWIEIQKQKFRSYWILKKF
jgi:hypothetical protein